MTRKTRQITKTIRWYKNKEWCNKSRKSKIKRSYQNSRERIENIEEEKNKQVIDGIQETENELQNKLKQNFDKILSWKWEEELKEK